MNVFFKITCEVLVLAPAQTQRPQVLVPAQGWPREPPELLKQDTNTLLFVLYSLLTPTSLTEE